MTTATDQLFAEDFRAKWTDQTDFGIADEKGRAVGNTTVIRMIDIVPSASRWGWTPEHVERNTGIAGIAERLRKGERPTVYSLDVYPTRDGEHFGASRRTHYRATEQQARDDAAKKVEASRKRYARKYA